MKKLLVVFLSVMALAVSQASAVFFTDTIDFSKSGGFDEAFVFKLLPPFSFDQVDTPLQMSVRNDSGFSNLEMFCLDGQGISYSHMFDIPTGSILTDASLSITYGMIESPWLLTSGNEPLGYLDKSYGGIWQTSTFSLNQNILSKISTDDSWCLDLSIANPSSQLNSIRLVSSEFSGNYTSAPSPVPEPGSMALFGSGLFGAVGFIYRRKKSLS